MLSNMYFLPSSPLPLFFSSVFSLIIFIWRLCKPRHLQTCTVFSIPPLSFYSTFALLFFSYFFKIPSLCMNFKSPEFYYLCVHFSCLISGRDSFPAIYCTIDIKHIFLFKNWYSIKSEKIP